MQPLKDVTAELRYGAGAKWRRKMLHRFRTSRNMICSDSSSLINLSSCFSVFINNSEIKWFQNRLNDVGGSALLHNIWPHTQTSSSAAQSLICRWREMKLNLCPENRTQLLFSSLCLCVTHISQSQSSLRLGWKYMQWQLKSLWCVSAEACVHDICSSYYQSWNMESVWLERPQVTLNPTLTSTCEGRL